MQADIPERMLAMGGQQKKVPSRARGGFARKEKLSQQQRSEIARKAAIIRHTFNKPLEAIRKGNFKESFGFDAECYVVNDERKTAVISQRGMAVALGIASSSGTALKSLISTKAISDSSVGVEIKRNASNPLIFNDLTVGGKPPQPRPVYGYNVSLLIDICNALVEAHDQGRLLTSQIRLAENARILLAASAKSGIQNLVYRIAGYDASKEEVIAAFKAFVQEEAKKYEKEFPPELYLAWARLYSITAPIRGRSWKHRHLTVDHVYYPLAKSNGTLLTLLREAKHTDGGSKKLFQFLNEVGTRALRMHLGRILEMAESSKSIEEYELKIINRFGGQQGLYLPVS